MKKKPSAPRRDRNKEWCYAAGRVSRSADLPITAIRGLSLYGSFGTTRAEDLERAWTAGWTERDAEIRKETE